MITAVAAGDEDAGDPACWARLVCPECGELGGHRPECRVGGSVSPAVALATGPAASSTAALDVATVALRCQPVPPFRLDLTVWALRRRARNRVDDWDGRSYRRVLVVEGRPLLVRASQGGRSGSEPVTLEISACERDLSDQRVRTAREVVEHSLGVEIDLGGFYRMAGGDPCLAGLADRFQGVKPPRFPSLFEALANAVACQQLSLEVGIELLNRLAGAQGMSFGDLTSFPEAATIAAVSVASLRALGFSSRKAETLVRLAGVIAEGALDERAFDRLLRAEAMAALQRLDGIGRWSAEYVLLRGLGRLDVYPGDDIGARNKLRAIFGLAHPPDYAEVNRLAAGWGSYAGMVYFHLLLDGLAERGVILTEGLRSHG